MSKPTVRIKNASILNNHLFGVVIDYPNDHHAYPGCVTNGHEVMTSSIVSHEGDIVETQRTIYHVESWVKGRGA